MGESSTPPPPPPGALTLMQPSMKKKPNKPPSKIYRVLRNAFRSFPIIAPASCRLGGPSLPENKIVAAGGTKVTGTLFGHRRGRVSLSVQENSRTLPTVVVELGMQTHVLQKEMSLGMVRIAMECEKKMQRTSDEEQQLLDEPVWTMFCNGKKVGYGVRREATEEDLRVMEVLKAVSMGAGVLPGRKEGEEEVAYMRAHFEWVVGSVDSETFYMLSPDGGIKNQGPELTIFFVRV